MTRAFVASANLNASAAWGETKERSVKIVIFWSLESTESFVSARAITPSFCLKKSSLEKDSFFKSASSYESARSENRYRKRHAAFWLCAQMVDAIPFAIRLL